MHFLHAVTYLHHNINSKIVFVIVFDKINYVLISNSMTQKPRLVWVSPDKSDFVGLVLGLRLLSVVSLCCVICQRRDGFGSSVAVDTMTLVLKKQKQR